MVKVYQGGEAMKYEKPELEVVLFQTGDVITASVNQSGAGSDQDVGDQDISVIDIEDF